MMKGAVGLHLKPTPSLIVNGDDFGQTQGINRAIIELHQAGLLTSASLMARATATDQAIQLARATPSLGVGCHIVLTDGEPILPPSEVSSLIDPSTNLFIADLPVFLGRLFTGRTRAEEIEAETTAQIQYLQSSGIRVTHIDSHKHTHMFPGVLRPFLRGARTCGIQSVRNPFEPAWAIRATANCNFLRAAQVGMLRSLRSLWQRILVEEGFATTGGTLGVSSTGALEKTILRRLLNGIPEGTWELVTHPGYNDSELDRIPTLLRASRDIERDALAVLQEFPALHLISWRALLHEE